MVGFEVVGDGDGAGSAVGFGGRRDRLKFRHVDTFRAACKVEYGDAVIGGCVCVIGLPVHV